MVVIFAQLRLTLLKVDRSLLYILKTPNSSGFYLA